jgi:galactokinase
VHVDEVVVPALLDRTGAQALRILKDLRLIGRVQQAERGPTGRIVDQKPRPRERVPVGTVVEVWVALREKAVLGARMTGGGFGGAAILLVKSAGVTEVQATLAESYRARFGMDPHLYATESADGMHADDES